MTPGLIGSTFTWRLRMKIAICNMKKSFQSYSVVLLHILMNQINHAYQRNVCHQQKFQNKKSTSNEV